MSAKHRALRLGLTGGVGCGKSTAAAVLKELGAAVVDADAISHSLTMAGGAAVEPILAQFGAQMGDGQGGIDRRALGELVFAQPQQRRALEGILHPAIQKEMMRQIDAADQEGAPVVVLDVPLLYECGLDALCDQVWVMSVDQEQQVLRVLKRDQISRDQALSRIRSQMPLEEKRARAQRVVDTGRSEAEVKNELKRLYRELTKEIARRG
ncbi:MAG TPA: dephospho-CoA kinase [Candidatus Excrementavichristensenella intestinipullorum]|nr:dephospho-CoA kinase [Candidatus Excrementavichristensenella intestinipullorum]